jgi:DNA-binding MarR family transcriptional regulator
MSIVKSEALNPTLWRTCRVLANKTRLRVIRELCSRPEQRVSDVAGRLHLSLSLVSQSLRALNARGLLRARRIGKYVYYSPCANRSIQFSTPLLRAILRTITKDKQSNANIYRYATAFTHPRRILIITTLYKRPMRLKEIAIKTNISRNALDRHLRKLISRGFLTHADRWYVCSVPRHKFARLLLRLATKD